MHRCVFQRPTHGILGQLQSVQIVQAASAGRYAYDLVDPSLSPHDWISNLPKECYQS